MINSLTRLLDTLSPLRSISDWGIRGALAATFIIHGMGKLDNIAAGAAKFGVAEPLWMLVAYVEIGGAIAILIGGLSAAPLMKLISRLGFASLIPIMIGAIVLVPENNWRFNDMPRGMEFEVLIIAVCLYGLIADLKRT